MKDIMIKLRNDGKTYKEIAKELTCSESTVKYHLIPNRKESEILRAKKYKSKNPLIDKLDSFSKQKLKCCRNGFTRNDENHITQKDILDKFGLQTKCYLTGEPIDLTKSKTYSFDHIIPKSKGGESNMENLGICTHEVNMAKHDKSPEDFFMLCIKVLEYNGYKVEKLNK